jgi:hypothetical protein
MTTFVMNMNVDMYLHQNRAEVVEVFDGCLLDNYLAYSDKAIIAIYEECINRNRSQWRVEYARIGTDDARWIEDTFYKRMDEAYREDIA